MSAWRIGTEAAYGGVRGATASEPKSGKAKLQAFADRLTKWIPGDTLALYVPGVTYLAADNSEPSVLFLAVMISATPLFVISAAWANGSKITKCVWVSALLGALAFAIWSISVPLGGWQRWSFIAGHRAGTAIGAAIVGIIFSNIAEGTVKRVC